MSRRAPRLPCLAAACLVLASGLTGQVQRFDGWARVMDPAFRFDPDSAPVLGFSVRATDAARTSLERARSALDRGDTRTAARLLMDLAGDAPDEVVQVQQGRARWVGAAEWAVYTLGARVPADVRAGLAAPEDRNALEQAIAWRDTEALSRLSRRLAGLPEARRATAVRARLLAEQGDVSGAQAAVDRALQQGSEGPLHELLARLRSVPGLPPAPLRLPRELEQTWRRQFTTAWLPARNPPPRVTPANPFAQNRKRYEAPMAPIIPVVRDGVAYVADSVSVEAVNVYSGRVLWHWAGPMERLAEPEGGSEHFVFGVYANLNRPRAISPWQVARPTVTDDLVLATVQVPERKSPLHWFEGIPNHWPLPHRRLVALDRATGELCWRQERPALGSADFRNRLNVHGPPAVDGGQVYVSGSITEGAIHAWAAAFDLRTGSLLWRSYLCSGQQELTMFNRPFQEHVTSPALARDGSVWLCTNLGVVGCVDGPSGRVRWLAAYPTVARRPARSPFRNMPREILWSNRVPVLEAGRLLVAPLDGASLLALDPNTGRLAYEIPTQPRTRRSGPRSSTRHDFVGSGDGRVLVASDRSLEAFDATTGSLLWSGPELFDNQPGEIDGALVRSGDQLLVPTSWGLFLVDGRTGALQEHREWPEVGGARVLVPAGPLLVMADEEKMSAALDVHAALQLGRARAVDSMAARLELGELLLGLDRWEEAAAEFEAVRAGGDEPLLDRRARGGLLQAALQRARNQHTARAWEHVLAVAQGEGLLGLHAAEALIELAAAGAGEQVDHWLEMLARGPDDRPLDLGSLTPDGPQPAGLVLAIRRLERDDPRLAVARIQDLVLRYPEASWRGASVRAEGSRRIAELLDRHGEDLYAEFERQAQRELEQADDAVTLEEVERRYPNSRTVAERRLQRMTEQLRQGRLAYLFEETGTYLAGGAAEALRGDLGPLLGLRAEAARGLGEHAFAEALEGGASAPAPPPAWPLPGPGAQTSRHQVTRHHRVGLLEVLGRPQAEHSASILGCVHGEGSLFRFDTDTDRIAWREPLPGGATSVSESDAFLLDGPVLLAYCRQGDGVLQARLYEDGSLRWSVDPPGTMLHMTLASGLVVMLSMVPEEGYRLDAWGVVSGVRALSLPLSGYDEVQLLRAGAHVLLRTREADDVRLFSVDLATGRISPLAAPGGDVQHVVATIDDPPTLLLVERVAAGSMLTAFDPSAGSVRWSRELPPDTLGFRPVGPGTVLLVRRLRTLPGEPAQDRVTLVDARTGRTVEASPGSPTVVAHGQGHGPAPRVVLVDTSAAARFVVLDASSGAPLYDIDLEVPLRGSLRLAHGHDGVLLASDSFDSSLAVSVITVHVARGARGEERYSFEVRSTRPDGPLGLALADGAIVLARGGTLWSIRGRQR